MLEVDAREPASLWREGDLDFAGVRNVGIELPLTIELPGDQQPVRRLPFEDPTPVTLAAVGGALKTPAADLPFDDRGLQPVFEQLVAARPPRIKAGSEHGEGALGRRLHVDRLPYR